MLRRTEYLNGWRMGEQERGRLRVAIQSRTHGAEDDLFKPNELGSHS